MKTHLNFIRGCSRSEAGASSSDFSHSIAAFLIAAPHSGSGKTTIARGLMVLFRRKGYTVQPFKCGPDYIDTKFHERVCGRPSVNLDSFFASEEHLRELFSHYSEGADIAVVEGMMGLYDGYDRDRGSSAEIARILDLPIVLVVDAHSAAYSMAALLQGFIQFRPGLTYAGVIFNKVGSERHFQMLQQVCEDLQVPCLGYLPKDVSLEQGSRYLGLDFTEKTENEELVHLLGEHVDWRRMISEERRLTTLCQHPKTHLDNKILVARNAESFSFLYQETLDHLASLGSVEFFDPEDKSFTLHPSSYTFLFLPGGYPEKHLEALVRNEACRKAILEYAEQGGHIIAECGGMMYLCQSIITDDGEYPMCGVLPYKISVRKTDCRLSLGYRKFVLDGKEYRGHEFHYTQFLNDVPPSIVQVYNAQGEPVPTPIIRYKNVLASYTHIYNSYELKK